MFNFTVPMALADFIPVVLFGIAAVILQQELYNKMTKYAYALLAADTINIFFAGATKATWKLLYAAGICNFERLNAIFMPTQSLGFFVTGISLLMVVCSKKTKKNVLYSAPPVFTGTFVFLFFIIGGLAMETVAL